MVSLGVQKCLVWFSAFVICIVYLLHKNRTQKHELVRTNLSILGIYEESHPEKVDQQAGGTELKKC